MTEKVETLWPANQSKAITPRQQVFRRGVMGDGKVVAILSTLNYYGRGAGRFSDSLQAMLKSVKPGA